MTTKKENPNYKEEQNKKFEEWHGIEKILRGFSIKDEMLATCFNNLGIKGLSANNLRNPGVLSGKAPVTTYEKAIEGTKRIFPNYNFSDKKAIDKTEHEADLQAALKGNPRCLSNSSKQEDMESLPQQFRAGDQQILDNLEGIYYGYFYDNERYNFQVKNFLFFIKRDGGVELRAGDTYYKSGKVIFDSLNVAFLLNSRNGNSPELYYTKLPKNFDGDDFEVTKIILTGVWANIDSDPSFGSSLLFKHGDIYNFESGLAVLKEIKDKGSLKELDLKELQIQSDSLKDKCEEELKKGEELGIIYKTTSQNKPNINKTALIKHRIKKVQK